MYTLLRISALELGDTHANVTLDVVDERVVRVHASVTYAVEESPNIFIVRVQNFEQVRAAELGQLPIHVTPELEGFVRSQRDVISRAIGELLLRTRFA